MDTTIALITGANKGIGFETARQLGTPRRISTATADSVRQRRRAEVSVHLATLDASGPSGTVWGYLWSPRGAYGALPW